MSATFVHLLVVARGHRLTFFVVVAHLVARHLQAWLSLLEEAANKPCNVVQGFTLHQLTLLSHNTWMESHIVNL